MKSLTAKDYKILKYLHEMKECPHCGTSVNAHNNIVRNSLGRYAEVESCDCGKQSTRRPMPPDWYPELKDNES